MRTILFFAFSLLITAAFSQKVMRLDSARTKGLTTELMDSLYLSAIDGADSTRSVFQGRTDEFVRRFQGTLQEIGAHLGRADFHWGKETRMVYRIFFTADGRVEHFHYQIRDGLPPERERELQQQLEGFVAQYRFPMQAKVPYKQCGTAVFKDQ